VKRAIDTLLKRTVYQAITFVSTKPALYYGLRDIIGGQDRLCIGPDTELVIEGYPRSANSTTVYGFIDRQIRHVKLAHHKHHAAQLLRAVDRGLPAVMLIRRPEDAALSNLALHEEARRRETGAGQQARLGYYNVVHSWLAFYRPLVPHLDKVVIAPFEWVTQDIEGMIRAINDKFGTDFANGPLLHERKQSLGWHALPSELRTKIKQELDEGFATARSNSARLRSLISQANDLHDEILEVYERRR